MKCVICQQRGGKRYCPEKRGYICALCCGAEREVTIDCPLDCDYLREAHRQEAKRAEPPAEQPYAAHQVTEQFLEENNTFISAVAARILEVSLESPGTRDSDVIVALDALVRTYETLSTGIVYETQPEGVPAKHVYRAVQDFAATFRDEQAQRAGINVMRDGDVLRSLVFLGRIARVRGNQRPRCRAFLGFLRRMFPTMSARQEQKLIVPGA